MIPEFIRRILGFIRAATTGSGAGDNSQEPITTRPQGGPDKMDTKTMFPVLEEAARRFSEKTGSNYDIMSAPEQIKVIDGLRAAFGAVASWSAEQGYGQRTRMMRALVDAEETLVSDDEALNEAIEAIDESDMDASHKARIKKALGSIRTRISTPRGGNAYSEG